MNIIIPEYPCGKYKKCPHCLWILQDPLLLKDTPWKDMKPTLIIKGDNINFDGVTIFDNHLFMTNTFNCVNGTIYNDFNKNHDENRLPSLMKGVYIFVDYLKKKFNVDNIEVVISSDYKRHGFKEHLHALVVIKDHIKNVFGEETEGKINVITSPYKGDLIMKIPYQLHKDLTMDKIERFITNKIMRPYIVRKNSFYLFLYFKNETFLSLLSIPPKY